MKLDNKELHSLADYLRGTAMSIDSALIACGIDKEDDDGDIEEQLLDAECEMCQCCGWWFETCELPDDPDNSGLCEDCQENN